MNGADWERFCETGYISDYLRYKMSEKVNCHMEDVWGSFILSERLQEKDTEEKSQQE